VTIYDFKENDSTKDIQQALTIIRRPVISEETKFPSLAWGYGLTP